MSRGCMTLAQAADELGVSPGTLKTMAQNGEISFAMRGENMVFTRDDLDLWASQKIVNEGMAGGDGHGPARPRHEETAHLLSELCPRECVCSALPGSSRASIIKALTELAEQSGFLYDPDDLRKEIAKREECGSTNLGNGVAIPHTMTREEGYFSQSFIAIAKLATPCYFNSAPDGSKTSLLILSCSSDSNEHLMILQKISEICRLTTFLADVEEAGSDEEIWQALLNAEEALVRKAGKKRGK